MDQKISHGQLQEWAEKRADDAGRLARGYLATRVLLKKYIDMIVAQEGHDYMNFVGDEFTDDEKETLKEIAYSE